MKGRVAAVLLSWVMVISCIVIVVDISGPVKGETTIYVDDDGGADYTTIQRAIDNANPGDTVYVFSGTYYENVIVYKSINLTGENRKTTIIDAERERSVITTTKDWTNITGFTVKNSGDYYDDAGIKLSGENNCRIYDNIIQSNEVNGIYLYQYSDNNIISNNEIYSSRYGINMHISSKNTITDNKIDNSDEVAIKIYSSNENTITGNTMNDCGLLISGSSVEDWNTHTIDDSNLINNKPIYYWKDKTSGTLPTNAGQVILANCMNVKIKNLDIDYVSAGIELGFSSDNIIMENEISSTRLYGIYQLYSNENDIVNNEILNNLKDGIYLTHSKENEIRNNVINGNDNDGLVIEYLSDDNVISGNQVDSNDDKGIRIHDCENNMVSENTLSDNYVGISLFRSVRTNLSSNEMSDCGILISGDELEQWNTHEIGTSNTVNGKSVYYLKNKSSIKFKEDAGQIILANCDNIKIAYMEIAETSVAITLGFSSNNYIISNQLSSSKHYGILLEYSDGNYILHNLIEDNDNGGIYIDISNGNNVTNNRVRNCKYGLYVTSCEDNKVLNNILSNNDNGIYTSWTWNNEIYHNNFINNQIQVKVPTPYGGGMIIRFNQNIWDNGYPSGGNYWSDYDGPDNNSSEDQDVFGSDGIGDEPYKIYYDNDDNYPLMEPLEIQVDVSPPVLSFSSIENQSIDVSPEENMIIEFDEPMDAESVESAISIAPEIGFSCKWENDNITLIVNFTEPLTYETTYEVTLGTEAQNTAGLSLNEEISIEFTTEAKPKDEISGEFPILIILILVLIVLVIVITTVYARRSRKPSEEFGPVSIDVNKVKQVTCPYCNNINQVIDTHDTVNFQCSFCNNNLTVHLGQELPHFQSASQIKTLTQISCPECRYVFDVQKSNGPIQVQCPNCGTKGMMR
jgi:parallel beta-helix repeat protein